MKKGKTLTKDQRVTREKAIIRDLREGKMSYRKIADRHHVSLPTVNAKARKAGITRSRRGPKAATMVRATQPRTYATSRKTKTRSTKAKWAKPTTTRRAYKRTVARKPAIGRTHGSEKFNESFRWLVMSFYPNMPLKKFEKLSKLISKVVS